MYSVKKLKKQNKTKTGMDGRTVGAGITDLLIINLAILGSYYTLCSPEVATFY